MGKPLSDQIESKTLDPMVLNPTTVNTYKEHTTLNKNELEVANNVIFDDGVTEKIPGTLLANSDTPGAMVTGLHRAYGPSTEKVLLRLANGSLKSGPPTFGTTVLSSLSTTKPTPFINIKGKTYGINEVDGLIRYDTKTTQGLLTGIIGPFLRKKIAFMESDETWVGGTSDHGSYAPDEWTGQSVTSIRIDALASGNSNANTNVTVDLSQFSNGKVSDDDDYINFRTKHTIYMNIDHITVEFSCGVTDFSVKFLVDLYREDFTQSDYQWTDWKVTKGSFIKTGLPTWAGVQAVRFTVYAMAAGPESINFDYMFLSAGPIRTTQLLIEIFDCESNVNETWAGDSVLSNLYAFQNYRSVSVVGTGATKTASCVLGTALDLTKWANGVSTSDSDEFVFHIYTNDASQLTNASCLTLRLGSDSSNYYYYTWATKAALGLNGNSQWFEVRLKKSVLDDLSVGAPNYNNISYIAFVTSSLAAGGTVYFDYLNLQPYGSPKSIADFESGETWTITGGGVVDAGRYSTWSGSGGVTSGSKCLHLWNGGIDLSTATWDCPIKDLTIWDDSSVSSADDYICFSLYSIYPDALFNYIEIWFDNNSLATFANAYKFRVEKTELVLNEPVSGVSNSRTVIKIPKSAFVKIGTSGGWNTIGAVRFISSTNGGSPVWGPGEVMIDNVLMRRKGRDQGRYYYKYAFMINDIFSALSDISEPVDTNYNTVLLTNIKTSQDSRVTARQVFRLGGIYSETWKYVKTIGNNTTTYMVDDLDDIDLTLSMGDEVPQGNIDLVKGNNLCYDPSTDRLIVWGDPDHKNYVRYSPPAYYYAFGEATYREMSDNVMFVASWYGQKFIWYKQKMQKIMGDIYDGELVDLPVNVGTCSYWGVRPIQNVIPFASWDNVYMFDGYNVIEIGNEVKNYFKGRESYLSLVNVGYCKDTVYIACMAPTGIPTYNSVVLRYYIPTKSWSIIPNWNVNVWDNWNQSDDQNELYYGDSVTGNIYSVNYGTYRFGSSAISSGIETGWINIPNSEIAIYSIEFKVKGTAGSILSFLGYKNMSAVAVCSGSITLTSDWLTYTLGPKNIWNILRGDNLKVAFAHATDSAYFKMKDLVINIEAISKRITLNEVTVSLI